MLPTVQCHKGWATFDATYSTKPYCSAVPPTHMLTTYIRTLWRLMESSTLFCSWTRFRMRTSPPLLSAQASISSEEESVKIRIHAVYTLKLNQSTHQDLMLIHMSALPSLTPPAKSQALTPELQNRTASAKQMYTLDICTYVFR